MNVTGHHNTDGVRAYKIKCEEQYNDVLQVSEHKQVKISELSEKENKRSGRATPVDTPATTLDLYESECKLGLASESELSKCTCIPSRLLLAISSQNISGCSLVTTNYRV